MTKRFLLVATILVTGIASAATISEVSGGDLLSDPVVREAVLRMLSGTHHGLSRLEIAEFIVRDADGNTTTVEWPETEIFDCAIWVGPLPAGTVAIVHTHPNWQPRPSRIDIATARRAQIPVYIVTQTQVWKTVAGVAFRVK